MNETTQLSGTLISYHHPEVYLQPQLSAIPKKREHRFCAPIFSQAACRVPVVWREWCERWFQTTTLQHSSRISVLYRLFNAGRWLAQSGYGAEPTDWSREVAAAYVAAIDRARVGQWTTGAATLPSHLGQPFKVALDH